MLLPAQSPFNSRFSDFISKLRTDSIPFSVLGGLFVLMLPTAFFVVVPLDGNNLIWVFSLGGNGFSKEGRVIKEKNKVV